mgnify:CR=1 FL=1
MKTIKQQKETITGQNEELELQKNNLSNFAHTVSHDLKTPINGIIGLIDLIEYENYEQFNRDKGFIKTGPKEKVGFFQTNKKNKLIGTSIIAVLVSYLGYDMTKENCMIWINNDHYEKVSCEKKEDLQALICRIWNKGYMTAVCDERED